MKIETIIAIVSAAIAFVTSIANLIYNIIQRRKDRTQKVVLDNRIKYLNEIREGYASFIGLANFESIKYAQNNIELMKIYFEKLLLGYGKIRTYLKPYYKIEKELLDTLDELYYCVLTVLNGKEVSKEFIAKLRDDFADQYLKYDWAYWKYIQRQKEGNFMDSDDDFDKVYDDNLRFVIYSLFNIFLSLQIS